MYLESFGLKKKPFSLTSDPSMLYFTDSHREALAALCYGLLERKGLILLLGTRARERRRCWRGRCWGCLPAGSSLRPW